MLRHRDEPEDPGATSSETIGRAADLLRSPPEAQRLRFHDLRHATTSLLMMAGANPAAVQRILGHSNPAITTGVYGHLAPNYLLAEVDLLTFGVKPPPTVERPNATIHVANLPPFVPALSPSLRAIPDVASHLLTAREVAALLGVSTSTIYGLCDRGELPHVRISNAIRISPADLEAFLNRMRFGRKIVGDRRRPID